MNPQTDLNHIVLKVRSITETKRFYSEFLGLENRSMDACFLSFQIGNFILNFSEAPTFESSWAMGIGHIGLQFSTRQAVDVWYSRFAANEGTLILSGISGGPGKGPYRFYAKDPNGYNFEFESWEGCSD